MLTDIAISGERTSQKDSKTKCLTTEIQPMWNVKTKVIPVIIEANGTISKSFRIYL
jgi:hypothetical protein